MKPPAVKIADLTDALDMIPNEASAWLDRTTGRVWIIQDHVMAAAESGDEADATGLSEWEEDEFAAAQAFCADSKRGVALPTPFDFHEYHHMEKFIATVADDDHADQLWRAIKGKGAFRHFKDTAHRLGVIDAWYAYRDAAARKFMLEWAESHGIEVDQSPGRAGP